MELSVKRRKKIFLLFFLGIGLPSLLLGYFAFRGIQNDQALLEKRRLDDHQRLVNKVTSSVDKSITEVEQAFLIILSNQNETEKSEFFLLLKDQKDQYPFVEETFLFRNADEIRFPAAELLFFPEGSLTNSAVSLTQSSHNQNFLTAQQLEFQQKNYQKAISTYQKVMAQAKDRILKGNCLNAIARVQKKAQLFQDAIKSYKTIAQDYSQIRIADGIPLGVAARFELGSLYLDIGETTSAIETFVELNKLMINREWLLEKAQYVFFSQAVKKSIQDIFSLESIPSEILDFKETCQNLQSEEISQRERTERLLLFQEKAATDIQAKTPPSTSDSSNPVKRCIVEIGRNVYYFSLLQRDDGKQSSPQDRLGVLFNASYLKDHMLPKILLNHAPSDKTSWIVLDGQGQQLVTSQHAPSSTLILKTNFAGNFPDWTLEFYHEEPHLFESFLTSRRSIYFYMFLLIGGILIFGLVLTVRAVSHELELARMKSDFVSTVSHEFKSPLTSIRQISEMLQSRRVPSEERRQRYYDVLLEQSERLSLLTENVLSFAKMEEGREEFEYEMVDIVKLMKDLVSTIQDRIRHEGFEIRMELENSLPSLKADSAAISQAITNLIDNAIKYSGGAKKIIVSAYKGNQYLDIAVKDFGVGIKKEEIDRVFDRFYRGGDELTRTIKGSGLGLTLVKQIVEAHHGSVQVESELEQGSTFSIRLPLQERRDA